MLEKDFARQLRRHHDQRLKRNRKNYFRFRKDDPNTARQLGIYLHSPRRCSCWMCGNPRKFEKERTLQERRHFDILKAGCLELTL